MVLNCLKRFDLYVMLGDIQQYLIPWNLGISPDSPALQRGVEPTRKLDSVQCFLQLNWDDRSFLISNSIQITEGIQLCSSNKFWFTDPNLKHSIGANHAEGGYHYRNSEFMFRLGQHSKKKQQSNCSFYNPVLTKVDLCGRFRSFGN